jgi:16S rRNA (uracil1498-N3)-methyltransferase
VFSRFVGFDRLLIAAPGQTTTLQEALQGIGHADSAIALLIGPEGGFTEEEVALAREKGAVAVGLGPRILRTETAAVAMCALVLYELGEMGP